MALFCGTDKIIIRDIQLTPQFLDAYNNIIDKLLRCFPFFLSFTFNLLPMLIRSSQIADIVSTQSFVTSHCIASNSSVGVTNMQLVARIINRGCNVKRLLI
ncbi:hypothetical protein D3C80_1900360 [compost metagenome]